MTGNEVVCQLFHERDAFRVPKSKLILVVGDFQALITYLKKELFIANPDHPLFDQVPESDLAPMRLERVHRRAAAYTK